MAPIVRMIEGEPSAGDLVPRRWSWPGQNRRPVYNFRSEGREFTSGRCLIVADNLYEFTDPAHKRKGERTSGSSRRRVNGFLHCWDYGGPTKMSAKPLQC